MKALILVGGYGTRLRPLTLSTPKPLVDFANKPMIIHQIEALKNAGVDEVVLAINYQPQVMKDFLAEWEVKLGIKIVCSQEEEPMGTAGPLALARDILSSGGEPFFVLNSDVICEYPLADMVTRHRETGAEATIMVTPVEKPEIYGVVVSDDACRVERFVEKPQVFVGSNINAGIYILNPSVLDRIEMRPTSIEREIFPKIAESGTLYSMVLPGFWMDVGQPKDYLIGLGLYLKSLEERSPQMLASGEDYVGPVLVHPTATVGKGCRIGPNVSIGANCVVADGVRLANTALLSNVRVKPGACVLRSLVGWHSKVGRWNRVEDSVFGEDVVCADDILINGGIILPHKEIKASIATPQIVL